MKNETLLRKKNRRNKHINQQTNMNNLLSLNEIFTRRMFRIPDYQRGYAWRVQKEVAEFWDDLCNLNGGQKHYTGLITLERTDDREGWGNVELPLKQGFQQYYVVDGQQRITTSVILIKAIYDYLLKQLGDENQFISDRMDVRLYQIREQYLKKGRSSLGMSYIFCYNESDRSYHYFVQNILEEKIAGSVGHSFYTINLEKAKAFFDKELAELDCEKVVDVYQKLTQDLRFNLFEIDSRSTEYNIFAAFETMNNRGKKLSNLELLKNRLIYLTTLYPNDAFGIVDPKVAEEERRKLRTEINAAWSEVYYQMGRNPEHPLDDDEFLRAHWLLSFQYTRRDGSDYVRYLLGEHFALSKVLKKFANVTDSSPTPVVGEDEMPDINEEEYASNRDNSEETDRLEPQDIWDYVQSLSHLASKWYLTFFPDERIVGEAERQWIDRLNRIGIGYFRPLVAATMLRECSEDKRIEMYKAIERFISIVPRMNFTRSNYGNSTLYKMAREYGIGLATIDDIIAYLNEADKESI